MRNFIVFFLVCVILILAIFIGLKRTSSDLSITNNSLAVPSIGRIEVLNGCGELKAAAKVADYLRKKSFDVKNIDDAEHWNYPFTIVVSRTLDKTIARKVCDALNTDKLIILRTGKELYNVSVFVGPDFGELIQ